ncbi:Hypothetical protein PBC10988_14880 [Planctomycetales bacterium 10988]|nr:Hypothetical protein PBC10988_14880 [Planctomycetales bacterium 10988]
MLVFLKRIYRNKLVPALAVLALLGSGLPISAEEPVDKFIDGLQQRKMFDVVEIYLESLRGDNSLPPTTKQLLPFLEGNNLLESAKSIQDGDVRLKQLDEASQKFQQFLKASPKHEKAALANSAIGKVLVEKGNSKLYDANLPDTPKGQKTKLIQESRGFFNQARKAYTDSIAQLEKEFDAFPRFIPTNDPRYVERDKVRENLLVTQLLEGQAIYSQAKAFEEQPQQQKKVLTEAAAAYGEIYEQFRHRVAGLQALMWQGLAYQEMKDFKQALARYEQILAIPAATEPVLRALQTKAMRLALQCHRENKKFDAGIGIGEEWVRSARGTEARTLDGLAVQLELARTYQGAMDATDNNNDKSNYRRNAIKYARSVAGDSNPLREEARGLLLTLDPNSNLGAGGEDFVSVFRAAKDALDLSQSAFTQAKSEKNQKKKEELLATAEDSELLAVQEFRRSLAMSDADGNPPPMDQLNQARYYLAFLHYMNEEFYHSGVLGEHLATKFPKSAVGRAASKIALASYLKAYSQVKQNKSADTSFEAGKMQDVAEFIIKSWPEEKEADEARLTIIDLLIQDGNTSELLKTLNQIPEDVPARASAELKAGNALWVAYLKQTAVQSAQEEGTQGVNLDQLAKQAQNLLQTGLDRLRKSEGSSVSAVQLGSQLSLAQVYITTGQPAKAVQLLENNKDGALTLIEKKHPAAKEENFQSEVLKAALQAYVGTREQEKAEETMKTLEAMFQGKGADAEGRLTEIFLKLGNDIKKDMDVLQEQNKTEELNRALTGFESFLKAIAKRNRGNTWRTFTWVADTFFKLGETAKEEAQLRSKANSYFQQASQTYQKVLKNYEADPSFIPDEEDRKLQVPRIRVQYAMCLRESGKYEDALAQLRDILKGNVSNLSAQVQACHTYMDQGRANKDYRLYYKALTGSDPVEGRNLIWGWLTMSKTLQGYLDQYPQFRTTFHEARYNSAYCLYQWGELEKDRTKKKNYLDQAEKTIAVTQQLYPQMGGDVWKAKYESLIRRIQTANNKNPVGLADL